MQYNIIRIIILDILVCGIAVHFYESCSILASLRGESKYKNWTKIPILDDKRGAYSRLYGNRPSEFQFSS